MRTFSYQTPVDNVVDSRTKGCIFAAVSRLADNERHCLPGLVMFHQQFLIVAGHLRTAATHMMAAHGVRRSSSVIFSRFGPTVSGKLKDISGPKSVNSNLVDEILMLSLTAVELAMRWRQSWNRFRVSAACACHEMSWKVEGWFHLCLQCLQPFFAHLQLSGILALAATCFTQCLLQQLHCDELITQPR